MKGNILLLLCVAVLLFAACGQAGSTDYEWLPKAANDKEILLFNRFTQQMLTFDTNSCSVVSVNDTDNFVQYEFTDNPFCPVFTSGHSYENHFKIIESVDGQARTLYEMEDDEAIFPLAYKNENEFFLVKYLYDKKGDEIREKRVICQYNKKENCLEELESTRGQIACKGVYADGCIYYTVYHEADGSYSLMRMEVRKPQGHLEVVADGLETPDLYFYKGELLHNDREYIYCGQSKFRKKTLNYIFKGYLLQIGPDADSYLEFQAVDLKKGKVAARVPNAVDFRLEGDVLAVYTINGREEVAW